MFVDLPKVSPKVGYKVEKPMNKKEKLIYNVAYYNRKLHFLITIRIPSELEDQIRCFKLKRVNIN